MHSYGELYNRMHFITCVQQLAVHLLKNKDGIVIVFMISSCLGSELHTTTKTAEMLDDREGD